jgi:hypothetical protein
MGFCAGDHLWKSLQGHLASTFEDLLLSARDRESVEDDLDAEVVGSAAPVGYNESGPPISRPMSFPQLQSDLLLQKLLEDMDPNDDLDGQSMLLLAHALVSGAWKDSQYDILIDEGTDKNHIIVGTPSADDGDVDDLFGGPQSVAIDEETNLFKKVISRVKVNVSVKSSSATTANQATAAFHRDRPSQQRAGNTVTADNASSSSSGACTDPVSEATEFVRSNLRNVGVRGVPSKLLVQAYVKFKSGKKKSFAEDNGTESMVVSSVAEEHNLKDRCAAEMETAIERIVDTGEAFIVPASTIGVLKVGDFLSDSSLPARDHADGESPETLLFHVSQVAVLKQFLSREQLLKLRTQGCKDIDEEDIDEQLYDDYGGIHEASCPWVSVTGQVNHRLYTALQSKVLSVLSLYPGSSVKALLLEMPMLTLAQTELLLNKMVEEGLVQCKVAKIGGIVLDGPFASPASSAPHDSQNRLARYFIV